MKAPISHGWEAELSAINGKRILVKTTAVSEGGIYPRAYLVLESPVANPSGSTGIFRTSLTSSYGPKTDRQFISFGSAPNGDSYLYGTTQVIDRINDPNFINKPLTVSFVTTDICGNIVTKTSPTTITLTGTATFDNTSPVIELNMGCGASISDDTSVKSFSMEILTPYGTKMDTIYRKTYTEGLQNGLLQTGTIPIMSSGGSEFGSVLENQYGFSGAVYDPSGQLIHQIMLMTIKAEDAAGNQTTVSANCQF